MPTYAVTCGQTVTLATLNGPSATATQTAHDVERPNSMLDSRNFQVLSKGSFCNSDVYSHSEGNWRTVHGQISGDSILYNFIETLLTFKKNLYRYKK